MVSSSSHPDPTPSGFPSTHIDVRALFEVLTGQKMPNELPLSSRAMSEDYEDLGNSNDDRPMLGKEPSPDEPPKDVNAGCINPYALVESMVGHRLDRRSLHTAQIVSDFLQTDYEELFDMKHNSVLYAGLKLNKENRQAEELSEKDIEIVDEQDLVTPDLSCVKTINDLEKVGLKDLGNTRIKMARMQNGKLRLIVDGQELGRTVGNHDVTKTINDLALPFRHDEEWEPPNGSWHNINDVLSRSIPRRFMLDGPLSPYGGPLGVREQYQHRFDDPTQGASLNSWLIAAIFSVFWANPAMINRSTPLMPGQMDRDRRTLKVKFHDKGGRNNAKTDTIEVDYQIPINNSTGMPIYARSSDGYETWPSLYEKAFVKWMTNTKDQDHVDMTQAHNGDPIKAMAQINGREPRYYFTDQHSAAELVGVVRSCSVNKRTISPMAAWTHATGDMFRGSNLVANHAYSVLGWVSEGQEENQYIIIRNPWGVTEPRGLTSYAGLLDRVEPEFWPPASLLDRDGVYSVEVQAFKKYFACIGVAK
ncbi:cysteine proteinase [Hypoxylon sp. FL0890]|nr:cysteine proteinase [Hypoxylon sp. FL0890]